MLRVLIIDDSPVARDLLTAILEGEPDVEVVGTACDGVEGVELVQRLEPDVVSMDVQMPRMDGYTATRAIMSSRPTPIVIVSGSMESPDVEKTMESLRAGALTVIGKPGSPVSPRFDKSSRTLVETLRTMAEVEVVRRRPEAAAPPARVLDEDRPFGIVAIAASTGGPQALHQLLSRLPVDFPLPILLVQHISRGFLDGFVSWLNDSVPLRVLEARAEQRLQPGTVYVSPEDRHLCMQSRRRVTLSDDPPVGGFRPAATTMFASVARVYASETIACILTGMGRDGVDGLRSVRKHKGLILAQNEATSVVYGMPAAAVEAGLVDTSESPQGIASTLIELVRSSKV